MLEGVALRPWIMIIAPLLSSGRGPSVAVG
jgi:hypothetical protein